MTEALIWLGILILAFVIEVITMSLLSIWFVGGSLVSMLLALVGVDFRIQLLVFAVVSLILWVFTRPIAVEYFNKNRSKTNVDSLVGTKVIVTEEINSIKGTGHATAAGQDWTARSIEADEVIPVGTIAEIVSISGVKLMVKATKEQVAPVEAAEVTAE